MLKIIISSICFQDSLYSIQWFTEPNQNTFKPEDLTISYPSEISDYKFHCLNAFIGTVVAGLAAETPKICIKIPFRLDKRMYEYWENTFKLLKIDTQIQWEEGEEYLDYPVFENKGRLGLLFGGGVESTFALSKTISASPVLFSLEGAEWMNNNKDSANVSIKETITNELVEKYNLQLIRIDVNAAYLCNRLELFVNKYISGLMFYFISLPVMQELGINILIKSSEMEEALNFSDHDLSLNPRITSEISPKFENFPFHFPFFNAFSKVQMFDELSKTDFLEFVYSCYHNSGQRWCGKCSKCFRISEYCERLGIPKSRIGIQEGIIGVIEKGVAANHWKLLDTLYGKAPAFKYSIMSIKIFYGRVVNKIQREIRNVLKKTDR